MLVGFTYECAGGDCKLSFDADNGLGLKTWEAYVFFCVVGGCGSGDDRQLRLIEKFLIRPDSDGPRANNTGRDENEQSCENDRA